jgi:hypothetical protein
MNAEHSQNSPPMNVARLHEALCRLDFNREIEVQLTDDSGKVHTGIIRQVLEGTKIKILATASPP